MINLGLIDLLLLVILFISFVRAIRTRNLFAFSLILIIIVLIELERLSPGISNVLNKAIHAIDKVNAQLPHIQIKPVLR
jgi:hypothetical protein